MRTTTLTIGLLLSLILSIAALAEPVWATQEVPARRWLDNADVVQTTVEKDARLDVIFREEGWVRVRLPGGQGYGWIPDDKVTTVEPLSAIGGDLTAPRTELPPIQLDIP